MESWIFLLLGVGLGAIGLRSRNSLVRLAEDLTRSPPERHQFWYRLLTFIASLFFVFGIVGAIIIQWGYQ
jgi:hypothetical protein